MTGKGLSGATVHVEAELAGKTNDSAPDRVIQQGEWLLKNAAQHLPWVHELLPNGYLMEALDAVDTHLVELPAVVHALQTSVWKYAPYNLVNTPKTMVKVALILETHAPHLVGATLEKLAYIRATEDCLSHGDPTAENVMLRDGDYVVIDPIPSTEAVPDDLAVDVGKLLQSAHGWEAMKGEERATWQPEWVQQHFNRDVFEMGERWCVVHFVRTLPYVAEEVKPLVLTKVAELLCV